MVPVFNEILGREVITPYQPASIVSLSPAITETLFMLDLGERIIGVSAFSARPEEARKKSRVGSYGTTNVDSAAGLPCTSRPKLHNGLDSVAVRET